MTQAALTSGQLEALRGTNTVTPKYTGRVRISTCPNDEIYRGQVNQASFSAIGFAQFTFDGGVGTRSNVKVGMRILISRTNVISKAYFNGRIRANNSGVVTTSTTININETSADIKDNDYFWIIWDYQILDKLGREVAGVLKADYEINFRQLLPVIYNLKSAYVKEIAPGASIISLAFAPLVLIPTSGASAGTWAWDVADGTITVGSSSTQNITATFPQGFRWVTVSHTDNGSRVGYKRFAVWSHGSSFVPQLMTVDNINVSGDVDRGYDATLDNYQAVAGLLDNTLVVMWSDDSFQDGTVGSLLGDNILFIGRIRTSEDSVRASENYGREAGVQYTVEGPLTQLAKTEQRAYEMLNVATPTKFGQITNMTIWRGCVYLLSEYSTFLELHSLTFDDTSNTYLAPTRNPTGNILTAVNDLALSINAALQINAAGEAEIVRDGSMLEDATPRNALITRAAVTSSDLRDISNYKHGHARPTGQLKGSAGSYQTSPDRYNECESIAPIVRETGDGETSLTRQVLPANLATIAGGAGAVILNKRAGHALEKAQEPDVMQVLFMDSWHSALIPARNVWYTFTLDGTETISAIVLTSATRWWLRNVSISHGNDGTKEVTGTFVKETTGAAGRTVTYPTPSTPTLPTLPSLPPIPMFPTPLPPSPLPVPPPPPGEVFNVPRDGNCWLVAGEMGGVPSLLLTTTMLLLDTPYTRDITPPLLTNEVIKQALFNRFNKGVYCLTYNTSLETSRVWYAPDMTDYPMLWTAGVAVAGSASEMRLGNANGKVSILIRGDTTENFNFTVRNSGWTVGDLGQYTNGVGWTETQAAGGPDPANEYVGAEILFVLGSVTVKRVSFTYSIVTGVLDLPVNNGVYLNGSAVAVQAQPATGNGTFTCTYEGSTPNVTEIALTVIAGFRLGSHVSPGGSCTITEVSITYTLATPIDPKTCYSADFGATLSTPEIVGTTASWIDAQKDGTQVLVSTTTQTRKASGGAAWADYGSAKPGGAGFMPRYLLPPGTASNSGSNPQYVLFASALDSGASMWMVKSSGAAFTDITPVSGGIKGLSTGRRCLTGHWQNSSHILALALFTATVKLARTLDGGTTWQFSAACNAGAFSIVTQIGDRSQKLCGWANGAKVAICRNYQATTPTFVERTFNLTSISALDVFG